ncbi:hypothetical protein R9X47_29040 [Wukongibacter baidiensis]|uniref:hypothetical protein n=1 Tax=Wukongibacter baidiensis TaxID=1723361 RepID=UPI003D7F966D
MRFYVVAKCRNEQNEDLTLNLENMTFDKLKVDEKIEEDKTYVWANGQIIEIRNVDFNMKYLYLEAFGKARRIKRGDFRFSKIKRGSNVYINENYFLFNGEKLIGRIINLGEIEEIDNKGIENFNMLLKKLLLNDIVVLVKGKKIYRIFTYAKLNNLLNDNNQIDIFQFMNRNYTSDLLTELKKMIDAAYNNLDEARQRMDEELNKNNEK